MSSEQERLLRDWIDTATDSKGVRRGARSMMRNLVLESDWWDGGPPGLVTGSVTEMATELRMSRNTFLKYEAVLIAAGLLERRQTATNSEDVPRSGWRIPDDVFVWLVDGEPIPARCRP